MRGAFLASRAALPGLRDGGGHIINMSPPICTKGLAGKTPYLISKFGMTLLAEGIGDTLRISYAADPIHEIEDGKELLYCLGLRRRVEPELIACP